MWARLILLNLGVLAPAALRSTLDPAFHAKSLVVSMPDPDLSSLTQSSPSSATATSP